VALDTLLGRALTQEVFMDHRFLRIFLFRIFLAAFFALTLATVPAPAQGNGNGKRKGRDKKETEERVPDEDAGRAYALYGFRSHDRALVTSYYAKHGSGLPPGLAKRNGNLPPGLEKQLERNGALPPGLQNKLEPCPVELTRELPPLPAIYERGIIGAHIVVVKKKHQHHCRRNEGRRPLAPRGPGKQPETARKGSKGQRP
jgi:hypothetical protein